MAKRPEYLIPTNFKEAGYWFNGMIASRNFIDAVALAIIGWSVSKWIPVPQSAVLSVRLTIAGLFGIAGIFGVGGIPLSTFLLDVLRWTKRRKPYLYNTHSGTYTVTAADIMLNTPGIKDALADTLDKIRTTMQSKKTDYIEGETFQFSSDPELELLINAEQRLHKPAEEPSQAEAPAQQSDEGSETDKSTTVNNAVNFDELVQEIVLHDIEEGDF